MRAKERLADLLGRQHEDGGWSADPKLNRPSDAFATGQSLYALCLAAGVDEPASRTDNPVRQNSSDNPVRLESRTGLSGLRDPAAKAACERAVKFLVTTQDKNGARQVLTTAFSPPSGNAGREQETDAVYTYWGTAWATLSLLHTLPEGAKTTEKGK